MSTSIEPSTAAGPSPQTDRVIRELDVYVCNQMLGPGTQMFLLQSPLRPPWRPYHDEGLDKVKLKPKVKKLSAEAKIEVGGRNYSNQVEPSRRITSLPLQSARVDPRGAQLAGAFVEGDRLLLFPVDEVLQLRPCMAHLDKEREERGGRKGSDAEMAAAEEAKPELVALTVQVKRRETEHQAAARLRSYAYLQQQEEADSWVDLKFHDENSDMADKIWQQMSKVDELPAITAKMSRERYLEAIVPGAASLDQPPQEMDFGGNAGLIDLGKPSSYASRLEMEKQAAAAAAARGAAAASWGGSAARSGGGGTAAGGWGEPAAVLGSGSVGGAAAAVEALPDDVMAALPGVVAQVLKYQPVLSLDQIRRFIQNLPEGPAKPAGSVNDPSLHAALMASGNLVCIRRAYMHKTLNNPTLDPLRSVVLELLAEKESLKRSDIIEGAKVKGIQVSDTLYSKVVKELCVSRGGAWLLKSTD